MLRSERSLKSLGDKRTSKRAIARYLPSQREIRKEVDNGLEDILTRFFEKHLTREEKMPLTEMDYLHHLHDTRNNQAGGGDREEEKEFKPLWADDASTHEGGWSS